MPDELPQSHSVREHESIDKINRQKWFGLVWFGFGWGSVWFGSVLVLVRFDRLPVTSVWFNSLVRVPSVLSGEPSVDC